MSQFHRTEPAWGRLSGSLKEGPTNNMPRAIKTPATCNQEGSRPGQAGPFKALNIMIGVFILDGLIIGKEENVSGRVVVLCCSFRFRSMRNGNLDLFRVTAVFLPV